MITFLKGKHDNDKPFQLSRMNYFLVQLSIADLLTTGLTLFPEIGEKQSKSNSKKMIVLKTIKEQLKQMVVIIEQANTHNIAKHQTPPYSRVKCFRQSKCLHNTTCNEQDNSKL